MLALLALIGHFGRSHQPADHLSELLSRERFPQNWDVETPPPPTLGVAFYLLFALQPEDTQDD